MAVKRTGIHTRLNAIIKKSKGYNKEYHIKYLMDKYNISYNEAVFLIMYCGKSKIEKIIDENGVDKAMQIAKKEKDDRNKAFDQLFYMMNKF